MVKPLNITPDGPIREVINVRHLDLELYSYIPHLNPISGILFLFDGVNRDAAGIINKAKALAEHYRLALVAPVMNQKCFPKWRYHYAGVTRNHIIQPQIVWTYNIIQFLIDTMLERFRCSDLKVYLFGHSAGAQLISRVSAYTPLSDVNAVIASNASSYVMPLLNEPAPFGFKNIFPEQKAISKLKIYLAAPMTIYLGMCDVTDLHLSRSAFAIRQGKNRLERGRKLYQIGRQVARKYQSKFNWRLVELPGVGHSSRDMLNVNNFAMVLEN
jgi:hypothetical protein